MGLLRRLLNMLGIADDLVTLVGGWPVVLSAALTVAAVISGLYTIPTTYLIAAGTVTFAGALLCWNQLQGAVQRASLDDKVIFESLTAGIGKKDRNKISLQIGVVFRSRDHRALWYEIPEIQVVANDKTLAKPNFLNRGGEISPGGTQTFKYPSVENVCDPGEPIKGVISFKAIYGKAPSKMSKSRVMSLEFWLNPIADASGNPTNEYSNIIWLTLKNEKGTV